MQGVFFSAFRCLSRAMDERWGRGHSKRSSWIGGLSYVQRGSIGEIVDYHIHPNLGPGAIGTYLNFSA